MLQVFSGFKYNWEDGFSIKAEIDINSDDGNAIVIKANKAGLISLANHLMELSEDRFVTNHHIHLDESVGLENGSVELILEKI